jgi:hypothetical protein
MKNIIGTKMSRRTLTGILIIVGAVFIMIFTGKILISLVVIGLFVIGVYLIVSSIKKGNDENN